MDPINYSIDVQSPFQAALQGYQAGNAIRTNQLQQQQQQQALQLQQRRQQLLSDLAGKVNATADDYAAVMTQLPDLAEHLQKAWTTKNTAQQQSTASELLQTGAAIKSGRPEVAAQRLTGRADAIEQQNGGQVTRESQALRTQAQLITDHPQFALGQIQAMLAVNPNGKDAADTLAKFGTEQRADQLQPDLLREGKAKADKAVADAKTAGVTADFARPQAQADLDQKAAQLGLTKAQVRNIASEIGTRSAQLGLDRQKLQLETDKFLFEKSQKLQDIGQDGRKLVNDSAIASGAAKLSADRANDLANRITDIGNSWGSIGGWGEWIKKSTGSQDAVSELRQQYTQLRNSEGVKNLPPGPASDSDVKLALDGIPPATAAPQIMQSWLRGIAKLNDINAAIENARADYAANNKGLLGRAKTSFSAGGTDVVSGDSWVQISKRVAESAARKYTAEADKVKPPSGAALIPGSGTPEEQVQSAQRAGVAPRSVSFSSLRD